MGKQRYENINKHATANKWSDTVKWQFERMGKKLTSLPAIPSVEQTEADFLQSNRSTPTITWIGHSTFLIQLDGFNMITDPVWASRLGTFKRLTEPGLPIDQLPVIDFVFISHNHYDHLNYTSIKQLKGDPLFFVPIGLGRDFKRKGYTKVKEYNWWDEQEVDGFNIAFVPSQHWSKRRLTDTNKSHWGGWIVRGKEQTIYFAGDSGYFDGFVNIGERFDIDYCLMPIGSYDPSWFLANQHLNPEEAIQAFSETNARTMIPMHYGAYMLGDEPPMEALDRLHQEWEKKAYLDRHLSVLKIGETIRMEK